MRNTLQILLTLNSSGLMKFMNVPTFKNLLHSNQLAALKEGENLLTVNHTVWGSIQRVCSYDTNNMRVTKL